MNQSINHQSIKCDLLSEFSDGCIQFNAIAMSYLTSPDTTRLKSRLRTDVDIDPIDLFPTPDLTASVFSHKIKSSKENTTNHNKNKNITMNLTRQDTTTELQPEMDIEVMPDGTIDIVEHPCSLLEEGGQEQEATNPHTIRQLTGAAVAGGLTGLLLGGPVIGVVAGGASALAVSSRSKVGDMARKGGDAVARVGDRIQKWDETHHVVENATDGAVMSCQWCSTRLKPRSECAASFPSSLSARTTRTTTTIAAE
jgi:hypothetical protein